MKHYPVYLNLDRKSVLLIGAGQVGVQKIRALVESGAKVHVVSPTAEAEFHTLARRGKIRWSRRAYRPGDMKGVRLVIAATDDPREQKRISQEARARGIWCNVVDVPPLCDFIAPAIVTRGDIQIAISTGGAAPALAKYLRQKLERLLGPEHEDFVKMVKHMRPKILKLPKERRLALWQRIVNDSFLQQIRRHGIAPARKQLMAWMGESR